MNDRIRRVGLGVLGVLAFLAVWHLLTLGNGATDIPGPWLTFVGLWQLVLSGRLHRNVIASLFRVGWGFLLATGIGIPLGVALGRLAPLHAALNPVVQLLRPISPIAWLPIATLLFGEVRWFEPSDLAAIFLIFLSAVFPIVTATASAVAGIDARFLRSAANFGVTGWRLVATVLLPAAMPQILTGLRLSLGISWVVVVAAEMLGVQSGLGYQVNDARNNLRYDLVTGAMVVIAAIGLLLDLAMSSLERRALAMRGRR
jgi:NitT/TauT family transport system permease protein